MTNELKFQNPQKYILLKRINSKLYKLSPFRSSPPEVLSKEDVRQTWSKPTGERQHRSDKDKHTQQSRFATSSKSRPCTDTPPKSAAHLQNTPFRETTFGVLLLHVKRILKDLNYEKFLFIVVKRNSLAIKMDK